MKNALFRPGDKILFQFSRLAIEAGDFGEFLETFGLEHLPTGPALRPFFNSFGFVADGFDEDRREIYEIPEIRAFYRSFRQAWPFWFFACDLELPSLQAMTFCCLPSLRVVRREGAQSIDLFEFLPCCPVKRPVDPLIPFKDSMLDRVFFHERQLPFSMQCEEHMRVQTKAGKVIALDALLAELYERRLLSRPVLQVFRELGEKADPPQAIENESREGLLIPSVEAEGFRLESAFVEPTPGEPTFRPMKPILAFTLIGWRHNSRTEAIPAGGPLFHLSMSTGMLDQGNWCLPDVPCITRLLTKELQRLVSGGTPLDLFTAAGKHVVSTAKPFFVVDSPD